MKRIVKKSASLTLAVLLVLLSVVNLWASASSAVHVTPYMKHVWVDNQEPVFYDAGGNRVHLFSCNGSVYMPANIAADWLGCTLSVNRAAGTAAFTSGKRASVPTAHPDVPWENGAERFERYFSYGADVQPLRQFIVTVDGTPWTFESGGTTLYPFFVDETLYLPMRSVGERMGKVVTWVPRPPEGQHYYDDGISMDDPATQAQLEEMQSYLDQAYALYWKAAAAAQALSETGLTPTKAADTQDRVKEYLQQIGRLPTPSHPYLNKYDFPGLATSTTLYSEMDYLSDQLRSGAMTLQRAMDAGLADGVTITLLGRYAILNDAQNGLQCFAASMAAAG